MSAIITITGKNSAVTATLPVPRDFEVSGEFVCNEKQMAGGKIVRDVIGWRATLAGTWDYVSPAQLRALLTIARSGEFADITYPDQSGAVLMGAFTIEIGGQRIFSISRTGEAVWRGVELDAKSQEVS